ncbi:F-box protein isoform X1 [Haematococcus lacustris]|uniref:F-box protein isoform X1 n=1 Tax=Haematococcus lacustris TaxID=44745 RepID=A0A699YHZ6_HAELA|nr:F-box protein isoform X1 [Haematococcus lacustris]
MSTDSTCEHQAVCHMLQVFNRELGNPAEDFSNSCYDATVRFQGYDESSGLPLFQALYLPQGKVYSWDVCQVQPGAPVEVQWRVEQRHPFGWWAGVVREVRTRSVIVEFQQVEVNEDVRFGYLGGLRLLSPVESQQWQAQHLAVPELQPALGSGHRPEPETVIRGVGSQ